MSERWWDNIKGPLALLVLAVVFVACTGGLSEPALM